jgi:hypothetical protein
MSQINPPPALVSRSTSPPPHISSSTLASYSTPAYMPHQVGQYNQQIRSPYYTPVIKVEPNHPYSSPVLSSSGPYSYVQQNNGYSHDLKCDEAPASSQPHYGQMNYAPNQPKSLEQPLSPISIPTQQLFAQYVSAEDPEEWYH